MHAHRGSTTAVQARAGERITVLLILAARTVTAIVTQRVDRQAVATRTLVVSQGTRCVAVQGSDDVGPVL